MCDACQADLAKHVRSVYGMSWHTSRPWQSLKQTRQSHQANEVYTSFMQCRFADTPEEKARKLAKKTSLPSSKLTSYDLLQSLAGQYQLTMDGVHPGLPAGFAGFSATGVSDAASKHCDL